MFDEQYDKNGSETLWQMMRNSWTNYQIVRHYARKYHADKIYSNSIIEFVPFAPIVLRQKCRLSGIIYRIYLYDLEQRSKLSQLFDKAKFWIMSKANVFEKIFILNDKEGAERLNKIYGTRKFVSLPDPYVPLTSENLPSFRKEYGISEKKKLFVQFGALSTNKSTIEILESIKQLHPDEQNQYAFAFAGMVYEEIKPRFYELYNELKEKVQIVVRDEYCTYETFASLCMACDAILTPYKRCAQSSGLIGYAAQFHKPVIAPDKGLLGNLVRAYGLGLLISDITPESLAEAYRKVVNGDVNTPSDTYCKTNNVEEFQQVIFNHIIDN